MNRSFYLMVFAICLAANYGLISAAPAEALFAAPKNNFGSSLHSSNRIIRQAPPEFTPPPPPPPPEMSMDNFSRKKREAKGGGSMPTRKG